MKESIQILKALRQQADEIALAAMSQMPTDQRRWDAADVLRLACDRAIAALSEQPKPCAGFVCKGWTNGNVGCTGRHKPTDDDCRCNCRYCQQPKSAHPKPSAEQAQQPAPAGGDVLNKQGGFFNTQPALADVPREKYDRTRRELEAVEEDKRCALDLLTQERARAYKAETELAEARREWLRSIVGAATQAVLALGYDTECRIRNAISKDCGCAGCHRKWAKERLEAAIRALAEGGEGEK